MCITIKEYTEQDEMAIRAKDIAREIGVSEATVSLVINGKPGGSDKTRARVSGKIRELGFGYLLSGDGNNEYNAHRIGFVIYKDGGKLLGENSFFPLILDEIETTARELGFSVTIVYINRSRIEEDIKYINELNCSGCVIFATELHEKEVHFFKELAIPLVVLDNYFIDHNIASVKLNNQQGEHLAIKYLYKMGHRKIGYLGSGLEINSFEERQKAAMDALERFGLTGDKNYFFKVGYPNEEAQKGMAKILSMYSKEELPTAFVSDNDLVAVGAIRAIKDFGYQVPEDFSVVGYDDRPICTMVSPQITTIEIPRDLFGATAVRRLARIILYNEDPYTITSINGVLVERDSVKKLKQ